MTPPDHFLENFLDLHQLISGLTGKKMGLGAFSLLKDCQYLCNLDHA